MSTRPAHFMTSMVIKLFSWPASRVFSKSFSAKKEVKKASAQISALGVYEAYINGKRVGDYILAPGWTTYHKRLQYQTYDITDMLQKDNVIEINAGDGWLVENLGHYSMMPWMPQNDRPAVIAAVEIEYISSFASRYSISLIISPSCSIKRSLG